MATSSCSSSNGLVKNSTAPAFMAVTVVGMSPCAVRKMIGIASPEPVSSRCTARPSMPGSWRSSTRQLGPSPRSRPRNSRAEAKLSERKPAALNSPAIADRTSTSSSTTTTVGIARRLDTPLPHRCPPTQRSRILSAGTASIPRYLPLRAAGGAGMAVLTALQSIADIESFMAEYYEAWGGTDEDRIMSYYSDDVTIQIPGSLMQGQSAVREQLVRPFITAFPGNRHVVKSTIAGRSVVLVEFTFEAEHKGAFAGHAASDAPVVLPGCGVYEFDSAKRQITAARIY